MTTSSTLQTVRLVATREITERLRSKGFVVFTVLLVIGVAVVSVLPGLLGGSEPTRLGAVGPQAQQVAQAARSIGARSDDELTVRPLDDAAARAGVRDGDLDAALLDPGTLLVKSSTSATLTDLLATARRQLALQSALTGAGVTPAQQQQLLAVPRLSVQRLEADTSLQFTAKVAVGLAAAGLLYGLLIFYGLFVSQGMVQEKQSRVVEVLLSVVRPVPLLAGKILGLGVLGFVQVLLLVAVAAIGLTASGTFDVLSSGLDVLALVLAWYVLGFALYATLFAIAGSVVSRVEDLQATTTPVIIVLVASLYLVQFTIQQPASTGATLAAVLPFSAPLAQPLRAAAGVGEPWQIVASIVLTLLLLAVLLPIAARVYSGAALVTRGRASYRNLLRRDRQSARH